ncbi:hypothetical protein E3E35_03445 [Thermococcus sp. GR7]|uniref:hypothetical protein n=1 Tax=unclassified Thermococcus TaxID=2627626 RepID=UPI001430AB8D|nr:MULTISPECIES: hypothetical protein [unclassified Thermococcus]NJE46484.1 hypothetical protein [Thermococcus sp. GR7]NJE77596.1 hypothetical protein [Thermococcus sp. GR4]NJF23685.1 hypothetical protein [Thermococcus sp. GR5]
MNSTGRLIFITFAVVFLLVGYLSTSTSVSWESKGEFNHLSNVSTSSRVTIDMPLELELVYDIYPELGHERFENSLKSALGDVFASRNLWADFSHVRPIIVFPGKYPPDKINNPVVIISIPFHGHENNVYYESCYASVLIYMNSNGDMGSYLSVEERYSGDSTKTDDLRFFAKDLFNVAMDRGNSLGGNYSLAVVYWNVLEVRTGKLSGNDCWDVLAEEVAREVEKWAMTLKPSDEP